MRCCLWWLTFWSLLIASGCVEACPALVDGAWALNRARVVDLQARWAKEPSLEVLLEGALGPATADVQAIQWRGWLPEVEIEVFAQGKRRGMRRWGAETSRGGAAVGREGVSWQVVLWWDLSRLVFDPLEIRAEGMVSSISAMRADLMQEIASMQEVRRRLMLMEVVCGPGMAPERQIALALQIEALTARIEAVTGVSLDVCRRQRHDEIGGVGGVDLDDGARVGTSSGEEGGGGQSHGLVRP